MVVCRARRTAVPTHGIFPEAFPIPNDFPLHL
jgi:hypothetical protein